MTAHMESLIDTALKEDVQSGDITTMNIIPRDNSARGGGKAHALPYNTIQMKPCTPPAKKPRLFRVAYLSLIWLAATICALLFTAYPANASLMLNTSGDQNYTLDMAIPNLQLPEATGGTGTLDYTLTGPDGGALPEGLIFTPGTRTLSGTPSQPGATTLTYTVTDTSDAGTVTTSTSTTFTVRVHMLNTPDSQAYVLNRAITLQLPEAAGGKGPLVYTLTRRGGGALPGGLEFDADTRILSGTPSMNGYFPLTYTVTDANGVSTSVNFLLIVRGSVKLTAPLNQNYTQGMAIPDLQLPAATDGTGTRVYTLTGVPAGLTFDAGKRKLSGTPSALGSTLLTYTVTDANGDETSVTFTVTVNADLALNARGNRSYAQGRTIRDLQLPEAIGGTGTLVYTLTGPDGLDDLPAGLTFDAGTRTLSGTPSTVGVTTLTYTVTDTNNASTTATFTVNVIFSRGGNLGIVETDGLDYAQGRPFTRQLSEATGGIGTLTYTLTGLDGGPLPAGLTFDPDTRTLSGTPSMTGNFVMTYTVTDTNDTIQVFGRGIRISVFSNLRLNTSGNRGYTQNTLITDLQLPEATGGFGTLRYTLTGPDGLPMGLTFDAGTRTLSGTPSTVGVTTLTYTVTDINDAFTAMFSRRFTVTVNAGLALNASGDQNYTLDTAITDLQLPVATGGTGTLTYTLTAPGGGLPAGLTFDPGTRTLSGTPDTAGTTILTYMATDTSGVGTVTFSTTFTVKVNASLALSASGDQNYTQGTAISVQLPAATGGTMPLTYTLTGLPAGLTFTPGTRTLSGTPSTAATTTLTYRVTDDNGASTSVDFTVTVSDGLTFDSEPANQNYTQGTAIPDLQLPVATGGTEPLRYTLTSVPGLTFTPGTRILSGTPDTAATTTLTYRVTDTNGASTSVDFMVTVNAGLALTAPVDQNYTQGTAITDLPLPEASGGTEPLTYTLTGPGDSALQGGLDFTPGTRTLSGTPSTPATTTLTYEVTDTNGASDSVDFTVIVNAKLALDTPDDQNYTQDKAITNLELPAATGGTGTLTYTLTGLPGGLTFSGRTLSGTPDTDGDFTLTYEVSDANGASTSVDFTVIVNAKLALDTPDDQNYTQGRAITDLTLPAASGGTGTLTYTLTGLGGLPGGLNFTAGTRTLSGTPSTPGTTTLTYEVTDTNSASTTATFMVKVNAELGLNASGNQNYTQDRRIPGGLFLPEATGGTAPLTYTLTAPGGLPAGLEFNVNARLLFGPPSTPATTTLTYTVTDANGASKSVDFMVTVNPGLAPLTAPADQNYTQGRAITDLTLPAATGGTEPLTYTLTGLPPGLTFDTRTLSGTPDTPGTFDLTYEVTDANGASTDVTFMVTVNEGLALTASSNQNYTLNTAIPALTLPAADGGTGTLTYTLTGPGGLPGGLDFSGRTLSGTPDTAGDFTLTYEVMDANGASTTATFTVSVSDGLALSARGDQNYTQDKAITDLELPIASGGTAPLTYTLTSVPGLDFNANTRILSGTPSTADTFDLTYEVTDANGASTTATFTVIVSDGLALSARGDQNYTLDTAITDLELPEASGGTGTLTYTLTGPGDSALPGGLTFSGRILSGTPDTAGDFTLTYTVTDTNNATTTATFTVIVSDGLALSARGDQNYTQDKAITDLELPIASGGTAPLTYTLTSVPGLDFNANTRTLSGTPSTADTFDLTYEVTDANGASTTATFTVIVSDGLALSARGDQNYTLNTAITGLELPEADGGTGTLTYTLTGPGGLPGGLDFSGRTLSGTPDTAGDFTLTYTVTDTNDATTTATFTVIVSDGLALSARGDQNYTQDKAITDLELPIASGGTAPLTYTLTSVPGLDFNANTRTLSGTPSTADTFDLTYEVTDANGASTTATFTVIVSDGLALTASGNQNYTLDTEITALELPVATGGTGTRTYTLTGPSGLPGGLDFDVDTRILSGTPTEVGTTTLTYEVMDENGASTSVDFTVTVNAGLTLTASGNQNYTQGTAITDLPLPAATGGTMPLTYTLTSVPGLDFNAGTRTLSGTPSTATSTTTLTYEVTDANNASTSVDFTVTVNAGLTLTASGNQNYTLDTAITGLELPVATGGTMPLTYTLTGPSGGNLPAGLTFSGRTLSGTPTEVGTTTLTYEVMDENGASTSVDFTVTVNAGLALSARGDQNYTEDTAIPDLELPEASGGTEPLVYTLTGPGDSALPGGLTFSGRTLSGTPTEVGTTTLTYEVMDENGASTSVDFTVTVNAGLALSARGDQNYTEDTAIPDLELPEASGGTEPLVYTLTGPGDSALPGGLTFSGRTLSGTPDTAATTILTYTVMDDNGASTSVDFTVTVNEGLALTASGDQNYTQGTAITNLELPAATGGTALLVYTLTSVPGLDFDPGTRTLSGTPSTPATTTLTYMVSDANGASTTATFTVIVSDGLAAR